MKKVFLILLAVVLALSVGLIGCAAEQEEEEEEPGENIYLDFVTFWPSTDFQAGIGHVNWADTIEDRVAAETEHTVTIDFSYSVSPAELFVGVTAGTYDIVTTGTGYTGGIFPLWEGPEYPSGTPIRKNALTMSMTLQALYDEFTPLQDEMATENIKVMHFWSTGPGYFLMTEGNDVRVLADFTGPPQQRIRTPNPASTLAIEALGADPYKCPMSAALEAFQAGLIDGILCPTDTPKGFGLGAYVRSATFAPFSYHFVFVKLMNKDTWESLPSNVQTIFNEVNADYAEYYGQLRAWGEADGLSFCFATIPGFTLYDLPTEDPTEYQNWIDVTANLITDWIGGDATRQALWDKFVELDAYYHTTEPWVSWEPGASPPPRPEY